MFIEPSYNHVTNSISNNIDATESNVDIHNPHHTRITLDETRDFALDNTSAKKNHNEQR